MAIETTIQKRQTLQNVGYAIACLALAIWGWYDYAVKIPAMEASYIEYIGAEAIKNDLEAQAKVAPLGEAELTAFKAAETILAKYTEKPDQPAAYDRAIQLWLYIVGCGILGTPWFAYAQWRLSRQRFRLDDDGGFATATATYTADQLSGVDMSRWMSKSIAVVETVDGARIPLDDFKFKGVEAIVASLAARFHPGQWTSDARPVGDPKSRDTKAAAATAAEGSTDSTPAASDVADDAS